MRKTPLQDFIQARIDELQLLLDDQIFRYGGRALNSRAYKNINELLAENKRILAVLKGEIVIGGRIQ